MKFKIVRIKKTFRKYKEFWYNGMAGAIFFVTELNKDEYKVHDVGFILSDTLSNVAGMKPDKDHSGCMLLKRHVEVIGSF